MIEQQIEQQIKEWCQNGKELLDEILKGKKLQEKYKVAFGVTYIRAGEGETIETLDKNYKDFYKAYGEYTSKDLVFATKISSYIGAGKQLFCGSESSRQEIYAYMTKKGLMPEMPKKKQSNPNVDDQKKRWEEESKREDERRKEPDRKREDERERQKKQEEYRRYQEERERQRQQKQQGGRPTPPPPPPPKSKSKWWIWVIVAVALFAVFKTCNSCAKNGEEETNTVVNDTYYQNENNPSSGSQSGYSSYQRPSADAQTPQEEAAQTHSAEDIEPILSELSKQFDSSKGKSAVETCAEYGAIDGLQHVNKLLRKAEKASPNNGKVKQYRSQFNQILNQYNISL